MQSKTSLAKIDSKNFRFLQEHVYSQAGIVLEDDKPYLVENRLMPIVRQLGLASIDDLCSLLLATQEAGLSRQVVEAMTTNETYFFRSPAHYEAIRKVLLPRLKQDRRDLKRLRFWSAAASTGQEAYSLAMILLEDGLPGWNLQILGTDFSSEALERARSGRYKQIEVNRGLPAKLLVKYFHRSGLEWQLSEPVRQMARFETIDLRQRMLTLGPFDLVFCRNVLIYFDAETRKKILQELHGTLFRGGWLLLGATETAFDIEQWFDRQTVDGATVYVAL
jgi:chemotaxis protein methyltransferase CheR